VETILPLITSQDSDATYMSISTKSSFTNAFRTLVSRSLIRSTLLLWFVYFAFSFAYYGIVLLTSELSNGERRCAPVGRQQNDVRLYRDVLVTSIAGKRAKFLLNSRLSSSIFCSYVFFCSYHWFT
jgi:hypothetical protein